MINPLNDTKGTQAQRIPEAGGNGTVKSLKHHSIQALYIMKIKEKGYANRELKEKQKETKRKLRRLQRQQANYDPETLYKEITEAEKEDQQLFYKFVNT